MVLSKKCDPLGELFDWNDGHDAYHNGSPNPHTVGTEKSRVWLLGWQAAELAEEHDAFDLAELIHDVFGNDYYDEIDFEDEPEPLEINAHDFDIPDDKHPNFEE